MKHMAWTALLVLAMTAHARNVTRIGETPSHVRRIDERGSNVRSREAPRPPPASSQPQRSAAVDRQAVPQEQRSPAVEPPPPIVFQVPDEPAREWKSRQGSSLVGRLLAVSTDGTAILVADGRYISVHRGQLSWRDGRYLSHALRTAQRLSAESSP